MTDVEEFQTSLEDLLISRTLTVTMNSLALAPDTTQPGNFVCPFSRCEAAVILRPRTNGTFTFIGDPFTESHQSGQDQMYEHNDDEDELLSRFECMVLV